MVKVGIVGLGHMGQSLPICLEKMGNTIVPLKKCDVCWIVIDTPVNEEGHGNTESIFEAIKDTKPQLKDGVLVIVSSQIPVGTSKEIVKLLGKKFNYAYMPEHMRIGMGVEDFMNLKEVVIGIDNTDHEDQLLDVFMGKTVVFTSVVSAEMIKHATNAFLATSLCFIYDIADVCEAVGADVIDVTRALRSDHRIGQEAYLDASAGFSGGHLERDLDYLQKVAKLNKVQIPVLSAVIRKNTNRRRIILDKLGDVKGKRVAFWGVAYKPGASPSDNSLPAKLMRDLKNMGAQINFHDPYLDIGDADSYSVVEGCMAIICITPWEELKKLDFKKVAKLMAGPKIFFDARNYFKDIDMSMFKYTGVGR